jgi:Tol biopolymer transport system component
VRTGDRAQLTNNKETEEEPSYSPDGKSIAYMSYAGHDNEIYTINASGEDKTQLTNNDKDDFDPNYSPDEKRIVYWAYDGSPTRGYPDGEIYTMNAFDGGVSSNSPTTTVRTTSILPTRPTAKGSSTRA